jgi:sulfatase maturation enzyme AslB (radical SAM superfamily)
MWRTLTLCDLPEKADVLSETHVLDLPDGVPPLHSFYLYLSASCNLRCRHCWITPEFSDTPAPGKTVDPNALRDAVIEAKTLGLAHVKLTGGEPLLHPQFKEIVDMLTTEGLSISMETNGTLITEEMAHYLKEKTNMDFVSVSIDSSVAAEHDAFRGVRGAFDAALSGPVGSACGRRSGRGPSPLSGPGGSKRMGKFRERHQGSRCCLGGRMQVL